MIDRAGKSDIEQLKSIWNQVFKDEKELIEKFFISAFEKSIVYVWRHEGEIASVLYMIPTKDEGMYLYALATLPDYRKRGIMSSLIKYSLSQADRMGVKYVFLIPAEKKLYGYYEKLGFKKKMPALEIRFAKPVMAEEISAGEYLSFLENKDLSYRDDNIPFNKFIVDFVLYEHLSEGHKLVKIECGETTVGVAVTAGDADGAVMHFAVTGGGASLIEISENDKAWALAAELNGSSPACAGGYIPF